MRALRYPKSTSHSKPMWGSHATSASRLWLDVLRIEVFFAAPRPLGSPALPEHQEPLGLGSPPASLRSVAGELREVADELKGRHASACFEPSPIRRPHPATDPAVRVKTAQRGRPARSALTDSTRSFGIERGRCVRSGATRDRRAACIRYTDAGSCDLAGLTPAAVAGGCSGSGRLRWPASLTALTATVAV
jgi:hypothetical protein